MAFMAALIRRCVGFRQAAGISRQEEERLASHDHDIGPVVEAMGHDELLAFSEALDLRVRSGTATLEDFGELARARQELARRGEDGSNGAVGF